MSAEIGVKEIIWYTKCRWDLQENGSCTWNEIRLFVDFASSFKLLLLIYNAGWNTFCERELFVERSLSRRTHHWVFRCCRTENCPKQPFRDIAEIFLNFSLEFPKIFFKVFLKYLEQLCFKTPSPWTTSSENVELFKDTRAMKNTGVCLA